ncbi:Transcriptional regulator, IclR family [Actinomycetales bacterium JB111]|nr:Transcriptional regulator, IclR family [Actinomycetales bacterium JB111]
MKKLTLQQRPPYPIQSVDNALRLLQLLRDGGSIRLVDAASELDVAESTAHRLLAMLVYRGFALQDDSRRYVAGPSLGVRAIGAPWIHELRAAAQGPMEILAARLDETINLVVRVGINVRFIATAEARAVLRIGDRTGSVIPALGASSGKALLAQEPEERIRSLYRSKAAQVAGHALDDATYAWLLRELEAVRRTGYALSRAETEPDVGAIGVVVRGPEGRPIAALSAASPMSRLAGLTTRESREVLFECRDEISAVAAQLRVEAD